MTPSLLIVLGLGVWLIAFCYASAGHGGATGYIALFALCGLAPEFIRPAALVLNIIVAGIGTWHYARAGCFARRLFLPLIIPALPLAFIGGRLHLAPTLFSAIVGLVLLLSAIWLFVQPSAVRSLRPARYGVLGLTGAGLGLLAGLTGLGGGIFLMPLLLGARWAHPKMAAAISAPFVMLNSIFGLTAHLWHTGTFPLSVLPLAVMALLGGYAGAWLGSRVLPAVVIERLMAGILVVGGLKLLWVALPVL